MSRPPSFTPADEPLLRRAIALAMRGRGAVEPNPMVGCVLARAGQVIGEGFHAAFGAAHAEPQALTDCAARGATPAGATAYVTLEPCCHTNKKTPPCAPRLTEARVARVVVGCRDPNPQVDGGGLTMLRDAGVEVVEAPPPVAHECRQLIAPFIAGTVFLRPYVTLKWAQTADGHVAGARGEPLRITSPESDRAVHALRGRCDAIAVGTNTVLNDDPLLTARGVSGPRLLRRVVLSNTLRFSPESRLVKTASHDEPVIVYCSIAAADRDPAAVRALERSRVEVVPLPNHDGRFRFDDALLDLHLRGVAHLLVEPGPTLSRGLLARGQADRVWVFHSPHRLDLHPELAISLAPLVPYPAAGRVKIGPDELVEHLNDRSDVFFAPVPSADLQLTGQLAGGFTAATPP